MKWSKTIRFSLILIAMMISGIGSTILIHDESYQNFNSVQKENSNIKPLRINGFGTGFILDDQVQTKRIDPSENYSVYGPREQNVIQLPSSYDFSNDAAFPETRSQGSQGSCAAWALGYYAYGYLEAKDQGWDASSGDDACLVSPSWLYNKVNEGLDNGAYLHEVGMILEEFGAASWRSFPYNEDDLISWGNESAWREAPIHRALDFSVIDSSNIDETIEMIKNLIIQEIPVVFGLNANDFGETQYWNSDFILSSVDYNGDIPNHAQTIVGFDDDVGKDGELGSFRIVNSWGSSFGNNGYYYMTYDAFREIGENLYACFIEDIPNYNPSIIASWNFSRSPKRSDSITVGYGKYPSSILEKPLQFNGGTADRYPDFMAVDISEFSNYHDISRGDFYLLIEGNSNGNVANFLIDSYDEGYFINNSTRHSIPESGESFTVPGYGIVFLPDFPSSPMDFHIDSLNQSLLLSWNPPLDNGGLPITNYTVYRMNNEDQWDVCATLSNLTSFLDDNLTNGEQYSYCISANNTLLESFPSQSVTATPYTIPSAPIDLQITTIDNSIMLSWNPPIDDGGSPINGYNIYRKNDSESNPNYNIIYESFIGTNFEDPFEVSCNVTYFVSALNLAGEGFQSENVSFSFIFDAENSPDPADDDTNENPTNTETSSTDTSSIETTTDSSSLEDDDDSTNSGKPLGNFLTIIPVTVGLGSLGVLAAVGYAIMKSRR